MFALVSIRGFVFAVFSSIKVPPKKIMKILLFLKCFVNQGYFASLSMATLVIYHIRKIQTKQNENETSGDV